MASYNALIIALGNFFRQACFFLAQILIAKNIGLDSFGFYSFLFSIALIWEAFGSLGTRMSLWKHVAKNKKVDTSPIFLYFFSRLMLASICVFISFIFLSSLNNESSYYFLFFLIIIFFNQSTFDWIFLSMNDVKKVFIYNFLAGILYLSFLNIFFIFSINIIYLPAIFSASFLFPGIILASKFFSSLKIPSRRVIFRFIRRLVFFSKNFFLFDIIQRTYLSLPIILTFFATTPSLAGEFRLISLVLMLAVTLSTSLAFGFFNKIAERDSVKIIPISKATFLTILLLAPLSIYSSGISELTFLKNYFSPLIDLNNLLLILKVLVFISISNLIRELMIPLGNIKTSVISYITFFTIFLSLFAINEINSIKQIIIYIVISEVFSLLAILFLTRLGIYKHLSRIFLASWTRYFALILLSLIPIFIDLSYLLFVIPVFHLIIVVEYIYKTRKNA